MTLRRNLLDGLNPAQVEAVTHVEGPLLVLAGPGSGKTRVITHRIGYLMAEAGVAAKNILALTFTNKAAEEMKYRLGRLFGGDRPWAGTFHKLCARLLRQFAARAGLDPNFTIADQQDRLAILASVIKDLNYDVSHFLPSRIEATISNLKNDLVGPEAFLEHVRSYYDEVVSRVYPEFQNRLRRQALVDFDDLLLETVHLFRKHPDVRAALDQEYQYLLVDEYQDTNLAQYAIVRALSADHPNLCVTGDPDQSIYSWRGANLGNILNFEHDFPAAKVVRLEQNYRSTPSILRVADELIRHNANRKHKELVTANEDGIPVTIYCHASEEDEAGSVAAAIRQAVDLGARRYRDFAVFVRVGSLTRPFEAAFRMRRIPYQVIGGQSFFQRTQIRDLLAYARLAINPKDDAAFERSVNVPPRGLGSTSLGHLKKQAAATGRSLLDLCRPPIEVAGLKPKAKAALADFHELLVELMGLGGMAPPEALRTILERTGYGAMIDELPDPERDEAAAILSDFLATAQAYHELAPAATFFDFLVESSLLGDADRRDERSDLVTIMTLHAAKGLEFPVVFLVAFEQNVLPHERSIESGDIEEERRLSFVGMTRAREELYISYARRRQNQGRTREQSPSMFLEELPSDALRREDRSRRYDAEAGRTSFDEWNQEVPDSEPTIQVIRKPPKPSAADRFRLGMAVSHPDYGEGTILQLEGLGDSRRATVQFPSVGVKRFVLESSPLEPAR